MNKEIRVWYFSGSGQCKILSEYIAKNLESQGNKVEIKDITSLETRNNMKKDIVYCQIVLVFPIYGGDLPFPLRDFIRELKTKEASVLLIALWGNSHKGKALHNASEIFSSQGFIVNGAAEIVAEHSYLEQTFPVIGKRPTEAEKHQLIMFINNQLSKNKPIKPSINKDSILVRISCAFPQGFVPKLVSKINLQYSKCNECGICRKKCPTGAINEDFQIERKKCIMCLSCVTCCKKEARKFSIIRVAKRALGSHMKIQNENKYYY